MPFEGLFLQRVAGVFFINVFLEQIKNLLQTLSPPSHAGGTWMFPTSPAGQHSWTWWQLPHSAHLLFSLAYR